jgi:predicted DNA-binding protein with PD1-like motif
LDHLGSPRWHLLCVPLRTGPDPGRIGREDGSCKPRSDRARNRRISASFLETPSAVTDSRPCVHFEEVGLRSKLLHRDGGATYALVFAPGDEVISGLTAFAKDHGLDANDFTALGAFSSALLGFFDVAQKEHAHAVLGCGDGTTRGGHLLAGHAWPTLALILTEAPVQLRRRFNPSAGLALIDM